jgi:hypothetical protein
VTLRGRIDRLFRLLPAPPATGRAEAITRLLDRADGSDADRIDAGHTLTVGERATRVRALLERAARRMGDTAG